jgi:hypothetical protein
MAVIAKAQSRETNRYVMAPSDRRQVRKISSR